MGDDGTRSYAGFGGRIRVLAPPGMYTVTLKVGDERMSENLELQKDPSSEGSLLDIGAQTVRLLQIRDDMNAQIAVHEMFRRQIAELRGRLDQTSATNLATFNAMLREKSLPILVRKTN